MRIICNFLSKRKWSGSLRKKGLRQRLKHTNIREKFGDFLLCLLLTIYAFSGAGIFYSIERPAQEESRVQQKATADDRRDRLVQSILNLTDADQDGTNDSIVVLLKRYEQEIGCYDEYNDSSYTWSFWNAFYYAGTIFTTIGFGNLYCHTTAGQIVTIFYALFGIPLTLIVLKIVGFRLFSHASKLWRKLQKLWIKLMTSFHSCIDKHRRVSFQRHRKESLEESLTNLPLWLSIIVVVLYILIVAAIFTAVEPDWDYTTSVYFFFVTLSTIGLGDKVPHAEGVGYMLTFASVIVGLALLSMCFNVVQDTAENRYNKALKGVQAMLDLSSDCESYVSFDPRRLHPDIDDYIGLGALRYRQTHRLSVGTLYDVVSRLSRSGPGSRYSSVSRRRHMSKHYMQRRRKSSDGGRRFSISPAIKPALRKHSSTGNLNQLYGEMRISELRADVQKSLQFPRLYAPEPSKPADTMSVHSVSAAVDTEAVVTEQKDVFASDEDVDRRPGAIDSDPTSDIVHQDPAIAGSSKPAHTSLKTAMDNSSTEPSSSQSQDFWMTQRVPG